MTASSSQPQANSRAFPDGAAFRIEIPSVEGPRVLQAVIDEAGSRGVTVNRVSQGSGAMLLTGAELREMGTLGAAAGLEVCLFVGPRAAFDIGALARSPSGHSVYAAIRGQRQLTSAIDDVLRATEYGIRSFLVADLGLLAELSRRRAQGELPRDCTWKMSAYFASTNPATLEVLASLGVGTVNVPNDTPTDQLAEMRSAVAFPIDIYVEAPDSMGGTVRYDELPSIVAAAAPVHLKFGLSNAPSVYPSGGHIEAGAIAMAREKVRRAAIALEWMDRSGSTTTQSKPHAAGLAIPVVA